MDKIRFNRMTSAAVDFRTLITELDADLRQRNGEVMNLYDQHNVIEKIDTVVIAYVDDMPVACGCFKQFDQDAVELKRMFVRPIARGKGISAQILAELEKWAGELGFQYTVLETGFKQVEALGLYRKAGYTEIPKYGPYVDLPDSICFQKKLI